MVAMGNAVDNDVSCIVIAHATRKDFARVETAVNFILAILAKMEAGLL
jgi:hypothetical protein